MGGWVDFEMRRYFTLLLFIGLAWGQNNKLKTTDELMNMAYEKARSDNKHILLIFYADWCDPCSLYTEALDNKESKIFFDKNYVIVKLNAHGKKHKRNDGAKKYYEKLMDSDGMIIPATFIIDKEGNKKERFLGYPLSKDRIPQFLEVLDRYSSLDRYENQLYLDILAEYLQSLN